MNGLELNKIKNSIIKIFKDKLGGRLFAIISTGSITSKNHKKSWSDIDILIVVESLNLEIKKQIAEIIDILEKRYRFCFGINTISRDELYNPILPSISLDGKTLQALLDLKNYPKKLIFIKDRKQKKFYYPNNKQIREYSLLNIGMFLLRNRRTLTTQFPKTFKEYKNATSKEIRAAFIMTKLAIQYFTLHNCKNNQEIIQKAKNLFPKFNFNILKKSLSIINRWNQIKKYEQLEQIFREIDKFIENFSHYVFKKASK